MRKIISEVTEKNNPEINFSIRSERFNLIEGGKIESTFLKLRGDVDEVCDIESSIIDSSFLSMKNKSKLPSEK